MLTFDKLHRAIKKADLATLRAELDAGASANLANQFGWTLLMLAALQGNTRVGRLLLDRGADINIVNTFGQSSLVLAAGAGRISFVRMLVKAGATITGPQQTKIEGWLKDYYRIPERTITRMMRLFEAVNDSGASNFD